MSDAEKAQDDIRVGATAGVSDPGDIPWRTTSWSAGAEDVENGKVVKGVGESRQQPSTALGGKTVTFDLQRAELFENDDEKGGNKGEVPLHRDSEDDEEPAGGQAPTGNVTTDWVVVSDDERLELKELKKLKKKQRRSSAHKDYPTTKGVHDEQARHARHKKYLSSL